ncbi:hypothetical protein FHX82_001859 [Amycolatopsis bartoniae]|uniref:Uncharacterized protein n=1 Tax=Amycolatopsis bartoniae TaxID=941986 RepID=A0A8H9IPL3_9PSEU|nr:hypothetical protein [Amycolatopsis bartoniae]MBB2934839.1 hypothetical protein [Amycolatopsis bartoniae]TVT03080.1 hypothetical protein FNH07_26215 [Amycolatopsis bartoniae]GHF44421.1 hypothetical protein GCM10017566_16640 [Amycolatopsis bartoniae]
MVHYDIPAIQAAAKRLGALRDAFEDSQRLVGDGAGSATPFGTLDAGSDAHRDLTAFHAGVHDELGHATEHMERLATTLTKFTTSVQEVDTHGAHVVTRAAATTPKATLDAAAVPEISSAQPVLSDAQFDDAQ